MPILAINGGFGSGKTLILTILAKTFHEDGFKIYSNYKMDFSEFIDFSFIMNLVNDEEAIENCFIAGDEIYLWLESRTSTDEVNRIFSYFIMQSRKRNVTFGYTAQLGSMVDLRFRDLADYYILCESHTKNGIPYAFEYMIIKRGKKPIKLFLSVENAKEFYSLYDTKEIVDITSKEDYKSGQTISTLKILYDELINDPIILKLHQIEAIDMIRAKFPKMKIKEGIARTVFKMLKDKKMKEEILGE